MSHLAVKTTGFSMLYYLFDEIINAGLGKLPPAYSSLVGHGLVSTLLAEPCRLRVLDFGTKNQTLSIANCTGFQQVWYESVASPTSTAST